MKVKLMKRDLLTVVLLIGLLVVYFNPPARASEHAKDLCVAELATYVSLNQNTDLRSNRTIAALVIFLLCYNHALGGHP